MQLSPAGRTRKKYNTADPLSPLQARHVPVARACLCLRFPRHRAPAYVGPVKALGPLDAGDGVVRARLCLSDRCAASGHAKDAAAGGDDGVGGPGVIHGRPCRGDTLEAADDRARGVGSG